MSRQLFESRLGADFGSAQTRYANALPHALKNATPHPKTLYYLAKKWLFMSLQGW
jgi:hypothetical protein